MTYKMISEDKKTIEVWKIVPNFENYEVSSFGKLRNKHKRQLKGSVQKDHGKFNKTRVIYNLRKDGRKYRMYGSRLVAAAFLNLDLRNKASIVDHIDNNSMNNNKDNLQIISNRENTTKDAKNKYGYTGITKNGKGFRSYICIDGCQRNLGTFKTPILAHQAYLKALKEL